MSLPTHLQTRIEAARTLDELMLGLPDLLRSQFGADRATIYAIGPDRASLVSKIRTGPQSFTQLKLPIAAHSVAGYVALSRRLLNLGDVYDEAELRTHAQDLRFQPGVDRRTGYRSREMLAAPIIAEGEVLGVVQLINHLAGGPFGREVIEGVRRLCDALGPALQQRQAAAPRARTRFASSMPAGLLGRAELETAMRTAQADGRDLEDVLLSDYGLKPAAVGRALADHFAVPYIAFHAQRRAPGALLQQFDRSRAAQAQWLPLDASRQSLFAVCVDPEQVKAAGAVRAAFPQLQPVYCVTTRREFDAMLDHLFGSSEPAELPEGRRAELLDAVAGLVAGSARHGLSNLTIDTQPGERAGEIRFTVSGTLRLS